MGATTEISYGKRLIPQILDDVALHDPDRIVYSIASLNDGSVDLLNITAASFAKAVDKTAWWVQKHLGSPETIQPLAYIGPHDLRYVLLSYGAAKAGCTALFLSPKNSVEGALAVLNAATCNVWVRPTGQNDLPLMKQIFEVRQLQILDMPTVEELLIVDDVKPFPFTKHFDDVATEPFCMLHTSGTTGHPKPISWTHALIGTMDAVRLLPPVPGDGGLAPWTSIWNEGETIYSSFPMSHGAGIIMDILMPSLFDLRCVLGPSRILPNMGLIGALADHAGIDIWSMVPSLVDELGETPDVLSKFKNSKFICASGGPVTPQIAAKVNETIRILNLTGTTEGLFIGNLITERPDWHWFAFHPYSGFDFREIEPGIYEHWVVRNEHWRLFQGIFQTFPDKDEVNLKDLYIQHPTKSGLWAFKGRSDDVVVLSNGYKISPLTTESFISTHPAVLGCLVVGTGKQQAGLLIELLPGVTKTNALFDSIWETVEEASNQSTSKNRLQRNYVAFAEPDKPFIRTDKGTVKRAATLALYADFIERFYASREDDGEAIAVDTSSVESIAASLRPVWGEALPEVAEISIDSDLFELGLDSLFVFRTISTIRRSLKLDTKLGPQHLYANPTLRKFSAYLHQLLVAKSQRDTNGSAETEEERRLREMQAKMDDYRKRQSFKLNAMDYVNANHYMGMNLFFPMEEEMTFEETFSKLQAGLRRAFELIPAMSGKIMPCSDQEIGFRRGDLRIVIPAKSSDTAIPHQLKLQDLSETLPSFEQLRATSFPPSAVPDKLLLPCDPFPAYPADILVAYANFIKGGCILACNFHHGILDGVGVMVFLRTWAESCKYLNGDPSATCEWLHPESFNHSLPEILHDLNPDRIPVEEVDPNVWGFLPFVSPDNLKRAQHAGEVKPGGQNGTFQEHAVQQTPRTNRKPLPPAPTWPYLLGWPPAPDSQDRALRTAMFLITPENVQKLKAEVSKDPEGAKLSISDIVQAFFWRIAIRVRYTVAAKLRQTHIDDQDLAVLELPIDGRPYFSDMLPSTYMGSMLILNRPVMPVKTLVSLDTSITQVAGVLRKAAAQITPSLITDAFTLLRSLPYQDPAGQFSLADMGLDGMHSMISNMILFQPKEISFGDGVFANQGRLEALRPQIERGRERFRFIVILPLRPDGGVELLVGTLPEELEILQADPEVAKFAELVDQ